MRTAKKSSSSTAVDAGGRPRCWAYKPVFTGQWLFLHGRRKPVRTIGMLRAVRRKERSACWGFVVTSYRLYPLNRQGRVSDPQRSLARKTTPQGKRETANVIMVLNCGATPS